MLCERWSVHVLERKRVCACKRECVWERERESVCEKESMWESDRVCAHVLVTHHGSPRNAAFKTGAWIAVQVELCAVQLQLELLYSLDFVLDNFSLNCCTGWTMCCTTSACDCAVQTQLELLYRLNFVLYNFSLNCCTGWTLCCTTSAWIAVQFGLCAV